ncbi:MAG: riboflavin synthase [bacterium]
MFTGLVQQVGLLRRVERRGSGLRMHVSYAPWDEPVAIGESVAVQGICLTVCACGADELTFDVLAESVARTDLAALRSGAELNLERALRMSDRFGGHFMTGHIDGVGRVAARERVGEDWALAIACDAGLLGDMALKGSIAVSGVSLTIAALTSPGFSVHIIPHTWTHTALSKLAVGSLVNLETDLLAKHVRRCLEHPAAPVHGLTLEALHRAGFG